MSAAIHVSGASSVARTRAHSIAAGIRRRVLEHTLKNDGGYLSQACSAAEILGVLYGGAMNLGPVREPLLPRPFAGVPSATNRDYSYGFHFNGPHGRIYDRFILSPTHYSLPLYAALVEAGRMAAVGLDAFNRDGSSVEMIGAEHSPGMELMTGSLGQGLSQGIGMALARRMKGEPGRIWIFMSDGEFQIGMVWEAFQFMSHHKVDNIKILVDMNGQQCDGAVLSVMRLGGLAEKLTTFGAAVRSVDGHDIEALSSACATPHKDQPLVVLAATDPCHEISELRLNGGKLHYIRIKNEVEAARYRAILAGMEADRA
jgi:transketolase